MDKAISARLVVVVLILHLARWLLVVAKKSQLFSSIVVIVHSAMVIHG